MPRELPDVLKDQRGTFPIYLSFFALAAFLLLIVFGPGIGNRLGFLGERKEQQKSLAQITTPPPPADYDQDGFSDAIENYLGTNPARSCPTTTIANDEAVDAWPPDFNDNKIIQIDDANAVSSRFNRAAQGANRRYDLNGDGWVRIDDVYQVSSRFNQSCIYYPYKLTVTPTVQSVAFNWTPAIYTGAFSGATDREVLYAHDMTVSGKTNCDSVILSTPGASFVISYLTQGQTAYTWNTTDSLTVPNPIPGHKYCTVIAREGVPSSSFVTFTMGLYNLSATPSTTGQQVLFNWIPGIEVDRTNLYAFDLTVFSKTECNKDTLATLAGNPVVGFPTKGQTFWSWEILSGDSWPDPQPGHMYCSHLGELGKSLSNYVKFTMPAPTPVPIPPSPIPTP